MELPCNCNLKGIGNMLLLGHLNSSMGTYGGQMAVYVLRGKMRERYRTSIRQT